ncbi:ATP-binding protein [Candidatus Gracilibacteria bacterium]|nr:ATP-binding protein [Candidatus Gracilibacteria bacterium]
MIFPRTKLIEKFSESFTGNNSQYIALVGGIGVGKTTFIELLQRSLVLSGYVVESIFVTNEFPLESAIIANPDSNLIIIDSDNSLDISVIRTFIEFNSPESKVLFTSELSIETDDVENFTVSGISYREYAEGMGEIVDVGSIMGGIADIAKQNELRDTYIHLGQYAENLNNPEHIQISFTDKVSIMNLELFKKEEGDFLEFIRTLAMNVGDIFKEERIAKMMNISRRKVRKYTEILLRYNLIRANGPWVENPATELSRHVKIYFSDLSYFHAALGVGYYHGENKQGVIENFVLLELDRKLASTHDIRFYRKKSGAEVSFILIERSTGQLTPIEVTTRPTDIIPQSLRIFRETYGARIEHIMMTNDSIAGQQELDSIPVIILPHIAI